VRIEPELARKLNELFSRLPLRPEIAELLRWPLANVMAAALYFALGAVVSGFFSAYGLFPAPIWLPAAVAVVAAMAGEIRLFPGIFAGSLLTNAVLFAPPLHVTIIISLTNALGPIAGAVAMHRLRSNKGIFTSFAGVVRFLFCMMLLSPAVSAAGGAIALTIGQPLDISKLYSIWNAWWLCDAGGTLFLAPALLLWLGLEGSGGALVVARPDRQSILVWGAIAAFSALLFLTPPVEGGPLRPVLPFLLVVPLSWVALRMSLRSAYTLIALVAVIAAAGTVAGLGAFQGSAVANPLQMVGALVVVLEMDVLTTVALVSELHQAQNENRIKSMFLATTSHELRSPLNAILGFSEMIDSQAVGPIENAKYTDYARMIHTAGEHLLGVINGLLDLTKIEAGQFTLTEQLADLAEAIEEAVGLVAMQARAKQVDLTSLVAPDIGLLNADPRALRQILLNLLSNAVKFTPEGGNVTVNARHGIGGELNLLVRDSGVGIPPDRLERVFAPFERGNHAATAAIEGTGLGLSITRGLIALHGGTIRLESEVGKGTTAIVTFPARRLVSPIRVANSGLVEAAD
jgi:two-component system, cell cycle sensor histidine kinase PleC